MLLEGTAEGILFDPDYGGSDYVEGKWRLTSRHLFFNGELTTATEWQEILLEMRRDLLPFQPFMKALDRYGPSLPLDAAVCPDGRVKDTVELISKRVKEQQIAA